MRTNNVILTCADNGLCESVNKHALLCVNDMPVGSIVANCLPLVDCFRCALDRKTERIIVQPASLKRKQAIRGRMATHCFWRLYNKARFAWILRNKASSPPIPAKGHQRLVELEPPEDF